MNSEQKAKDLVDKFIPNVYCYLGSGMLTNLYDDDVALINAKKQAKICVEEIISVIEFMAESDEVDKLPFWKEVKEEIDKL